MEAKVITEIERLIKENQVIEKDGQQYVAQNYKPLRHVDRPGTIHLSTLQSLSEVAKGAAEADFLVITDNLSVQMMSGIHEVDKQRAILAEAAFDYVPYPFDRFIAAEEFAILLQTRFVMTDNAAGILAIASKLHIEDGVEVADNGMAQRVTVKKGISAASIATLAAWSLLHLRLVAASLPSRVVIQHSSMDYLAPIAGDFTATARLDGDWDTFLRMLTRRGRARIGLQAELDYEGRKAGLFHGEFVALDSNRL